MYGEYSGRLGYCECCEVRLCDENAALEDLCCECYVDRLIDEQEDNILRWFISENRYELIGFMKYNL